MTVDVVETSDKQYLDQIEESFRSKGTKKILVVDLYDNIGRTSKKLSQVLKNDPLERFELDSNGTWVVVKNPPPKKSPNAPKKVPSVLKQKLAGSPVPVPVPQNPPFTYVTEVADLTSVQSSLKAAKPKYIALDVEFNDKGTSDIPELVLIQISYFKGKEPVTIIFDHDCLKNHLRSVLDQIKSKIVIVHDGKMEVALLRHWYNFQLDKILDTQIVYESEKKIPFAGLSKFLGLANYSHVLKKTVHEQMDAGLCNWKKPISHDLLQYSADDVELLLKAVRDYTNNFTDQKLTKWVQQSTENLRSIAFPNLAKEMVFDDDYNIVSKVIYEGTDPKIEKVKILFEITDLKPILPPSIYEALERMSEKTIRDLILDLNERPRVYFNSGSSQFLFEDETIVFDEESMENLISHLEVGTDNRAILNGSFHRISVMRNSKDKVYGITLRMGRFVSGLATILSDIIYGEDSILFLGPPGTGKSSFIRDCIRMVGTQDKHLIVVDTSNELCGNGDYVHPLLYPARRLMVSSLDKQKDVMIEAVQNHTPEVLVIDEIGRPKEVDAAKTVKNRGVRIIASAHGSFDELFKNKDLNGLLGGFQQVILSDAMAKEQHDRRKVRLERAGQPVFDTIVELVKGSTGQVRIFRDISRKVDAKLNGEKITIEERWSTGEASMFVRLETLYQV